MPAVKKLQTEPSSSHLLISLTTTRNGAAEFSILLSVVDTIDIYM